MPKFSIIIPSFNTFKLMDKCLKHLENQTFKDFEVIVVDDCSTDDSFEKLVEYSKKSTLNMHVYKNSANVGPGATRNYGIEKSTGQYLMMVDADDYIESDAIEQINYIIDEKNVDCVFYDYYDDNLKHLYYRDTVDSTQEGYINKSDALVYSSGSVVGKVYKAEIIKNNNVKFLDLKRNEDMPFNKIAISYCNKFYYIKYAIYHYIMHSNSIMHNVKTLDEDNETIAFEFLNKMLKDRFPTETEAIFIREYLYGKTMTLIEKKYKNKDIKKQIKKAKEIYPNWNKSEIIKKYPKHQRLCLKYIDSENVLMLKLLFFIKRAIVKILGK